LTVVNWTGVIGATGGTDRLLFANSSFLPGTSSSQITFDIGGSLYGAAFMSVDANTVEAVAAVPEPSTMVGGCLLGLLVGWRERKRLCALLPLLRRVPSLR